MKKFFKKTIFWQRLRDTLAVFGVPSGALAAYFETEPFWLAVSAASAALIAIIAIWFVDKDDNGVVDLFEGK